MSFMIYLVIINIMAILLCFVDKGRAIRHEFRISEDLLLFISLIGGCFGFIVGMNMFHHKTRKMKFKLVYLFCIMWLFVFMS